ncbi:MAG: helicase [Phycisphaerae bacterium]|nr:helicase [Phycisphaerae bacterium]
MIAFAPQDGLDADALLGPDGLIARQWPAFESRPQQVTMARRIQQAMREGFHLAAEAGTGVGKSFAYLAAAIDQAVRQTGKVLISTYTLNLQQQLIEKDIPFLEEIIPGSFTARLAKGRGHYLCRRRLEYALRHQQTLFDDTAQLAALAAWAAETSDGSLSDLPSAPSADVWQLVQSEHGNCRGRKCFYFSKCFYWRARRTLETADIIVANHALLFSDLALKEAGVGILPEYTYVVVDEAHNLEHVAEEYFGIRISQYAVVSLLDRLYHHRKRKGLLAYAKEGSQARTAVQACRRAARLFFGQVQAWYAHSGQDSAARCQPEFVEDNLSPSLRTLRLALANLAKQSRDEDQQYELTRFGDQLNGLETDLKDFVGQRREGCVYWVEIEQNRRTKIHLRSAPLDAGPYIKRCLFDAYKSVVLTSATLSCAPEGRDEEGFAFFADRIGLDTYKALQVGSPFDYQRQVRLFIEADLPDPNEEAFLEPACEAIKKYLLKSGGRAFVLFTSYSMLTETANRLRDWMTEQKMELLVQGGTLDRARMLARFKQGSRSVLFGTDSFWQGVDVPGESLSNVIIVKLPFAVPNHPLIAGRIDMLKQRGENPFFAYQLPMAVIKFKQGFGRLIRTRQDTGMVVVLDSRIVRKSYGRQFLDAIPKCRIDIVGLHDWAD